MVPYKRHSADTIEKIIQGAADDCGTDCEERTIKRIILWWQIVAPYFLNILKALYEKYKIPYNSTPSFREIVRAVVNSGNWIFARSLCTRSVSLSG
jgi:hypothetical protein